MVSGNLILKYLSTGNGVEYCEYIIKIIKSWYWEILSWNILQQEMVMNVINIWSWLPNHGIRKSYPETSLNRKWCGISCTGWTSKQPELSLWMSGWSQPYNITSTAYKRYTMVWLIRNFCIELSPKNGSHFLDSLHELNELAGAFPWAECPQWAGKPRRRCRGGHFSTTSFWLKMFVDIAKPRNQWHTHITFIWMIDLWHCAGSRHIQHGQHGSGRTDQVDFTKTLVKRVWETD